MRSEYRLGSQLHSNGPVLQEPRFRERHYSVPEIAEAWNLSRDAVRKLFEREAGVLVLGNDGGRGKRGYHTLRVPESVMERVHRGLCNS